MSQDGSTALSLASKKSVTPVEVFWLLSAAGAQVSWIDRDLAFLQSFFLSEGSSLLRQKQFWFEFLTSGSDHRFELLQALIESYPTAERTAVAKTVADLQFGGVKCMGAITDEKCQQYLRDLVCFCGRYQLEEGPPVHISATSIVVKAKDHRAPSVADAFKQALLSDLGSTDQLEYAGFCQALSTLTQAPSTLTKSEFLSKVCADGKACGINDFTKYCDATLGDPSAVVIKFMSSKDQFGQELQQQELRRDGSQYVVSILHHSDSEDLKARWQSEVGALLALSGRPVSYPYGVVMYAGDRNLMSIFNFENPGIDAIKVISRQVLEALGYIHDKGVMHGDVKMLNVTRFNHDNRLRLIDFDASCPIDSISSYAGAKFSSSCVPPEMLHRFESTEEVDKFNAYWHSSGIKYDSEESKAAWLEKIAPKKFKQYTYCVKSFITHQSGLPYLPELASASVDIWSVGVMLYQLATAQSLVKIDRNDDIASGEGYHTIYTWSETACQSRLLAVKDLALRDLISKMLSRDPEQRLSCSELLNHPFFTYNALSSDGAVLAKLNAIQVKQEDLARGIWGVLDKLVTIEGLALSLRGEMSLGFDTMKRYIKATADVTVPTLFIITPVRDASLYAELTREAASFSKSSTKLIEFFSQASQFYDSVSSFALDPTKSVMSLLNDIYEMHLLCELCYEKAVTPGVWPVAIDKRKDGVSKTLHSLLPLARAGLGVAKIVNGAAGVARIMGYPVPSFQLDGVDLSIFKHDSSLQDYSGLEKALFDTAKSSGDVGSHEQLDGYSQREFARFLAENDQKDDRGKLKRILLDEGCAMWCCPKCCEKLQANPKASYKDLRASVGNPVPATVAEERAPLPQVQTTNAHQEVQLMTPSVGHSVLSAAPATQGDIARMEQMLSTLIATTSKADKLASVEQKVDGLARVASQVHYTRAISVSEGDIRQTSPRYVSSAEKGQCMLS